MRGMMRFCVFVGFLALSIASCSLDQPLDPTPLVATERTATPLHTPTSTPTATPMVSTPMPLPSGLAKKWRLVEEVVDGETQPPFAEGMWFQISSSSSSGWWGDSCDHCSGYIRWSDGCNDHENGFKITDSGAFWIDFLVGQMSAELCVEIDPETGEVKPAVFPDHGRFIEAVRSANAYELREGRLWLYYADGQKALVFE
jgi:hypothetical protein